MMANGTGPFEDRIKTADLEESDTTCLTISGIKKAYLCSNIAVQGYVRLLHALIDYMHLKTGLEPNTLDAEQLIDELKPYLGPVL